MRLAVFSHYFLPEIGAPSARIGDFAAQWIDARHEVHVATCFPSHPTGVVYPGYKLAGYRHEMLRRIHVHRSWTYVTPNRGVLKKSIGHASLWLSARILSARHIPPPACAIGSSPTFFAAMAARDFARRHRVPFIMEVRDLWPAIFVDLGVVRSRPVIRLLERWEMNLYRSASRIVTVTESFRRNIVARGIPAERVVTITNGADVGYWQPSPDRAMEMRQRLELGHSFIVLYIGAHGISQGLGSVLAAAERLAGDGRIRFLFVGEGADRDGLVRQAARRGLNNVRFMDPVGREDVRAYYTMADVCLVPLRNVALFDSFIPSKMFEIMSVGRPMLASVGGEAEAILRRSGAAEIVPPEDSEAMAAAIGRLAGDRDRLDAMGRAGREFVVREYSRTTLARRYLAVIEEARLQRRNGP